MNDPKRWLDDGGGATFEERELLDAGRKAAMPSALRKRVWAGLATSAASLGAASEAAGAMGNAATKGVLSTLASSAAAKGVLAVALVGGTGLGLAAVHSSTRKVPAASIAAIVPSPVATSTIGVPPPRDETAASPTGVAPVAVAPSSAAANFGAPRPLPASRAGVSRRAPAATPNDDEARSRESPVESRGASRLREESAAVLAIRKTLLAGDAALALRMLDRARAEFPSGALTEEREALTVRALVASGQSELARQRGEAFLHAFPRSPHASDVRAILAP